MQKQMTVFPLLMFLLLPACENPEPPTPPSQSAPTAPTAEAPEASQPAVAPTTPGNESVKMAQAGDQGKKVYDSLCGACHAAGVAGAPKLGDKAAWASRIAQGMDALYAHAINGFQGKTGMMPPKGGNPSLSDADVMAAVDYMAMQIK